MINIENNMLHIDSNTFEISYVPTATSFEVDMQMANIIIVLNKNGYKTEFSCAGHYKMNTTIVETVAKTEITKEALVEYLKENELRYLREDKQKYYYESLIMAVTCYIVFDKDVILPFYPESFNFDHESNKIWFPINYYNDYEGLAKRGKETVENDIQLALNILNDWVYQLPVMKRHKVGIFKI